MKKRYFLFLCVLVLVIFLVGCAPAPDATGVTKKPGVVKDKPLVTISADKTNVKVGEQVSFTGSLSGIKGREEEFYCVDTFWYFGDGEELGIMPGCTEYEPGMEIQTTFATKYNYPKAGSYQATLKVGDILSDPLTITVK